MSTSADPAARDATAETRTKAARPCLVVGYDGSDSARAAASWAGASLPEDGRLVLVYACRPLHAPPSPLASTDERRRLGRAMLDELALDGEEALLDALADTEVSEQDPVSALIEAANRYDADAIVLGAQRHSALHRAIGTVTRELIERSSVPVTVVPAP